VLPIQIELSLFSLDHPCSASKTICDAGVKESDLNLCAPTFLEQRSWWSTYQVAQRTLRTVER
jgi:hypothetical protein